ncbi:ribonuclease H-like domain-containing protein [Tanacetum coccineum]
MKFHHHHPPHPSQTPTTQQNPQQFQHQTSYLNKREEYEIWAHEIGNYLAIQDYPIWVQRKEIEKQGPLCLWPLPEVHLAIFHKKTDAKEMWDCSIKSDLVNDESKKMQKYILKQQFEGFSISNSEGLSLPSAWSQVSLIMRTKPGVDSLSFDDLYNNLRVFESDVKGSTASSSSTQNVVFVSENTSSTNEVSTTYGASTSSGHNPQREISSSYTDELMYSFFANQSSGPQLDHEHLRQLDEFDLEEMDLKWQVAMISMRLNKFYKKIGRKLQLDAKELVGFDKAKVECYNCHKTGHFARECRSKENQDSRRRDAGYIGYKAKDSGRRPGKQEEPKALVTLDGDGIDWISHSEYEQENYALMAYSNSGSDTEMSARDKAGLGNGNQMHKGALSYENEVFGSVFDRIYIPSGPDVEIDELQFTYGLKQSKPSESDARSSDFNSCESNSSEETLESMPEPVVNEPKVVSQPKVWSDAPIIEEYESDSDDDCVTTTSKEQEQPSFAFINTVKHVKTPRQTVKEQNTCSQSPKPNKKDCSGLMSKKLGLGYGFTKKACFVCGSFSHLIRDCDFHEKRMAKQAELNKRMCKGTGQRENRTVWNNVQRVNHQNQFVPTTVLTRTGRIPVNTVRASSTNNVNTARHNFNSQAVPTNAARKVNTVKPIVNNFRPKTVFHKTHSPIRRPLNRTTTPRTNFSNQKVNTAEVKGVSAIGGKRETAVKPSAGLIRRPKVYPQRALKNKGIVDSDDQA